MAQLRDKNNALERKNEAMTSDNVRLEEENNRLAHQNSALAVDREVMHHWLNGLTVSMWRLTYDCVYRATGSADCPYKVIHIYPPFTVLSDELLKEALKKALSKILNEGGKIWGQVWSDN
ncbi:uncharacterized protein A1O5_07064 [Cladophialophora psammophila CBS 110553]|uniref:Uncharacterized protein n=1 Tax=Cladophialophora psammophila CBS 110553 TaxID=1182543 RepID=W9WZ95_9EURO|nr:uncharacterized protein A1O5_07064 [Cladophialophora psammophila CBS 110553]EXJ69991.1 hypothetical protein A1O5_07064 [Cladophialophora psammophila CBS 110553]